MSVSISYDNELLTTLEDSKSVILNCKDKVFSGNITVRNEGGNAEDTADVLYNGVKLFTLQHGETGIMNCAWLKSTGDIEVVCKIVTPDTPDVPEIPTGNFLVFTSTETFSMHKTSTATEWDGLLQYSLTGETWYDWDGGYVYTSKDCKIYLRGVGNTYVRARMMLLGTNISISGNIENLLDYTLVQSGQHPEMGVQAFMNLFNPNAWDTSGTNVGIVDASRVELPATTLTDSCYQGMFANCTGLKYAPSIPAIVGAKSSCYGMFSGCISLITLPAIHMLTLPEYCCSYMFSNCNNVKINTEQTEEYPYEYRIPSVSTAEAEDSALNYMFTGNTSIPTLVSTPSINTTYYTGNEIV